MNLDRDRRHGTVILTNSRHDRDCLPGYLAYWITAWQETAVLDPGTLAQYPGTYATPAGDVVVSRSGAHLSAQVSGHPSQRIEPEGNERFFSLSQDLELRFVRQPGARATGVVLRTSADPAFEG